MNYLAELKLATGPYKAARDAYVAATATYTKSLYERRRLFGYIGADGVEGGNAAVGGGQHGYSIMSYHGAGSTSIRSTGTWTFHQNTPPPQQKVRLLGWCKSLTVKAGRQAWRK